MYNFLDINRTYKCPSCNINLFAHVWNSKNVLSLSNKFTDFNHLDGFQYYRNVEYKCPNCNNEFYIKIQNDCNNNFIEEIKNILI